MATDKVLKGVLKSPLCGNTGARSDFSQGSLYRLCLFLRIQTASNCLVKITQDCFREIKLQATRSQLNAGLFSRNQTTGNWLAKITQARSCDFSYTRPGILLPKFGPHKNTRQQPKARDFHFQDSEQ